MDRRNEDQEKSEQVWDEDDVPLTGEIYSYDTYFTKDNELADPFDPYRMDEFSRDNKPDNVLLDAHTEFAGELSPAQTVYPDSFIHSTRGTAAADDGQEAVAPARSKTLGWIALVIAVASLFYWPAVFGPVAVIVGAVAYLRGSKALGVWSVALGLLALLSFLYLFPLLS